MTPDARTHRRIPHSPGPPTDLVAWGVRPQLLRPLLFQRPRPHRRHLLHQRHRLLPQPRGQGRVRPRPPRRRRHPDRGAPERRHRLRPAQPARARLPRRGQRTAAQAADDPRGDRGHRRRSHVERAVRRDPGAAPRDADRHAHYPRRATVRPARQLERRHRDRWRGDHRRPRGLDRQPRPIVGHPARSASPSPRAGPRTRRSRACGGCTCRWPSTTSRSA